MKRILLITNLLTLSILAFIFVKRYQSRQGQKEIATTEVSPCQYQLKYFDFHYRKEPDSVSVIMLGNSLIRQGNWDSLLNRKDVINRGISGDNLRCMCDRLSYLKNSTAKIVFVEGGINDIPGNNVDTLFKYYQQIISFWQAEKKIPVINLVLYISPKAGEKFPSRTDYKSINTTVKDLNDKLQTFAIENKIDFINLNPVLSDEQALQLKDNYTTDGVHLTSNAYKIWAEQVEILLNKYKI